MIDSNLGIFVLPLALLALACPSGDPSVPGIAQDRAIEIARQELSFEPDSVEAELLTSEARHVWQIVFTGRLPGQPPGLFETMIVEVDAASGKVVSIGRT